MKTLNLNLAHADTCLPSYWGGHHLPHIGVPISNSTTLSELKGMLWQELNECVCGNGLMTTLMNRQPIHTCELEELSEMMTEYGTGLEGLYDMVEVAAKLAITDLTSKSETPFKDLADDPDDVDDCGNESVQAYFVFVLEEV